MLEALIGVSLVLVSVGVVALSIAVTILGNRVSHLERQVCDMTTALLESPYGFRVDASDAP